MSEGMNSWFKSALWPVLKFRRDANIYSQWFLCSFHGVRSALENTGKIMALPPHKTVVTMYSFQAFTEGEPASPRGGGPQSVWRDDPVILMRTGRHLRSSPQKSMTNSLHLIWHDKEIWVWKFSKAESLEQGRLGAREQGRSWQHRPGERPRGSGAALGKGKVKASTHARSVLVTGIVESTGERSSKGPWVASPETGRGPVS